MTRYVALLRSVNIGGRSIRMDTLRALFVALGHTDVSTYVQSGNVVFTSTSTIDQPEGLRRDAEARLAADTGLEVKVLLRSAAEMAEVVANNPFVRAGEDASHLHVTFLDHEPEPHLLQDLPAPAPDAYRPGSRVVYLSCPEGYGRTKLHNAFWERRLRVVATTRNWRTVTTLAQLALAQVPSY